MATFAPVNFSNHVPYKYFGNNQDWVYKGAKSMLGICILSLITVLLLLIEFIANDS